MEQSSRGNRELEQYRKLSPEEKTHLKQTERNNEVVKNACVSGYDLYWKKEGCFLAIRVEGFWN